jgi:indolepyruvate ferredoxin oxidoreductase alpha subunit
MVVKKRISGNQAVALAALRAGVKVAAGYPGTPSTGALASLLEMKPAGVHVEWSTNEKVALEIATAAAWAGQRALCTMKMSGLNVAFDSLISIAYSGTIGGLVVYVADDPGVNAGMAEQDSRGFAAMADMPMIEPSTVAEAYSLTPFAFDLSEQIGGPVFVRLVTAIANSLATVEIVDPLPTACPGILDVLPREPILIKDIGRFTKAGSAICMAQHRDLIARLEKAGQIMSQQGLNRLQLAGEPAGLGIVAAGITASYLPEGLEIASRFGLDPETVSTLEVIGVHPFPMAEAQALMHHCGTLLVLEELEPHIEKGLYVAARHTPHGFEGRIIGKLDGTFSRIGEYNVNHVVRGIGVALNLDLRPAELFQGHHQAEQLAAQRPITVCAGCPHRGTFMAINQAIRKLRYKKDQVMVTGDIGCTILGMNPPFDTIWNEISMGASIGLAQGYVHSGIQTPVIATIGDSTFFHAGIPALINAVQHRVPITVIIMDNGWTSMTGMQVNPGTAQAQQGDGNRRVDIAQIVPALGVDHFFVIDPFDLAGSAATIQRALTLSGVKVVLARQECAMPAMRRGERAGRVRVVEENCNLCKLCITLTGCPAIGLAESTIALDPALCYGCGLCVDACHRDAIVEEAAA